MNRIKVHTIALNIIKNLRNNSSDLKIQKLFKSMAEEVEDPFASSIDEFLIEKQEKGKEPEEKTSEETPEEKESGEQEEVNDFGVAEPDHPQEQAVDEMKDEAVDYDAPKESDHPQEQAVEEMENETINYSEPGEKEDSPHDEIVERTIDEIKDDVHIVKEKSEDSEESEESEDSKEPDESEDKDREVRIESELKRIGSEIIERGYRKLGNCFIMASTTGIVTILNNLLMKEFLIKDIIDNYAYLLCPDVKAKADRYANKNIVYYLQKQVGSFNGTPTSQRLTIPPLREAGILDLIKEHEKQLIIDYMAAIKAIEAEEKYLTLKIMFAKIINIKDQLQQVE